MLVWVANNDLDARLRQQQLGGEAIQVLGLIDQDAVVGQAIGGHLRGQQVQRGAQSGSG